MQVVNKTDVYAIRKCLSEWNSGCFCFRMVEHKSWTTSLEYNAADGSWWDDEGIVHKLLAGFLNMLLGLTIDMSTFEPKRITIYKDLNMHVEMLLEPHMPLLLGSPEINTAGKMIEIYHFSYTIEFPITFESFKFSLAIPILHKLRLFIHGTNQNKRTKI